MMVGDMIFKFPACLKGYGIHNKMVMEVICIEVGSNNNFVLIAPHTLYGFQSDFVCFFGCYSPV